MIETVALTMIPRLGCRTQRQLLSLYGSAKAVFNLSATELQLVFGSHRAIIHSILSKETFDRAEQELEFCQRSNIRVLDFGSPEFPSRMKQDACLDAPILLYAMGSANLNPQRSLAVVGSRKASEYGRSATHSLVDGLRSTGATIVSGLAYGIDTEAHRAALENNLPTIAVLGHGLDQIYPAQNRELAKQILHGGALVTEYPHGTNIQQGMFPARNRIIAAISDACLVVEASLRGGALITANIANGYHRDLLAVPGRIGDVGSQGTNAIIRNGKAQLVAQADDICYALNWDFAPCSPRQTQIAEAADLTSDERKLVAVLQQNGGATFDVLLQKTTISSPKIAAALLSLEMKGYVKNCENEYFSTHQTK